MTATINDLLADLPSIDDLLDDTQPVHPAANDDERALLAWARDHTIDRPQPEMSRGRYKLPCPSGAKSPTTWTRMSGLAKTLDDTTGLDIWRSGLIARGFALTPELANVDPDDTPALRATANRAALLGGDKLRADLGTAMHTALEHHVLGTGERPPAPWTADLDAIVAALDLHGTTFIPEWVEAVLIAPQHGAAGRTDGLVTMDGRGLPLIADLKTGTKLDSGILTYAAQLAGYATATHRWTGPDGYEPMVPVDQTTGLIIHAPLGTGTCTIYELDLTEGADILAMCCAVRERRKGSAKLATPLETPGQLLDELTASVAATEPVEAAEVVEATTPEPVAEVVITADDTACRQALADTGEAVASLAAEELAAVNEGLTADLEARTVWIRERLAAIAAIEDPKGKNAVRKFWPAGTPVRPPWTDAQIGGIDTLLTQVEVLDEVPFAGTDPTKPSPDDLVAAKRAEQAAALDAAVLAATQTPDWPTPDDGAEVAGDQLAPLTAAVAALPVERRHLASAWAAEGRRQGRPWGRTVDGLWSERTYTVNIAVLRCIEHLWDDDEPAGLTRAALTLVVGEDLQPSWLTGAVLGSLTLAQARSLDDIAAAFGAGDATTTANLGAVVTRII